jgi:hypothetical protein
MTEQHTSFGGLAVADPRSATLPLDDDSVDGDDRRKLAIVGAVVAVLVVFVAAFFLMKGKGGDNGAAVPPHVTPPASTSTTQTGAATTPAKAVHLPKSYAGVVGRDPFKALYVAPADKSTGAGGASTTTSTGASSVTTSPTGTSTGTTTTTTGTTTPTTGSTGTGTTTGTATGLTADYVPVWVELVKVNGTSAATFVVGYTNGHRSRTVSYAGVQAPSGVRTVFAKVFSLLSIQNGTATVQVGDGTPFDLTKGFGNRHYLG